MYLNLDLIKDYLERKNKFHIVFLGDSLTSTEWVHPNWREIVEYVLKEEIIKIMPDWKIPSWGIRGINCGFDGSNSVNLLEKLDDILIYKPDLVISLFGDNDLHINLTPDQHKDNVVDLVKKIKEKVPYFVFCTSISAKDEDKFQYKDYSKYVEVLKNVLPIEGTYFLNLFEDFRKFNLSKFFTFISGGNEVEKMKEGEIDFLHPNQLGNAYIAKIILENCFGINFDPEKYIKENLEGKMYPDY